MKFGTTGDQTALTYFIAIVAVADAYGLDKPRYFDVFKEIFSTYYCTMNLPPPIYEPDTVY